MASKVSVFLRAVRSELKKVSWPNRPKLIRSTFIVIMAIIVFAIIIGGMDFLFFQILKLFLR
ncbi:MAG: preprotein translocase subunit SecE [bacterium]